LLSKFENNNEPRDRIFGVTRDNKEITLTKIIKVSELEYIALELFIGIHLINENHKFNKILVYFSHLEDWSEITRLCVSTKHKKSNPPYLSEGDEIEIRLNYQYPKIRKVKLNNLEISLKYTLSTDHIYLKMFSLKIKPYFEIQCVQEVCSYKEFIYIIKKLQYFLTLGIGTPIKIQEMYGYIENYGQTKEIKIVKSQISSNFEDYIHPYRMNFRLTDISDNFENILKIWFRKYEKLREICNLYFSVLYSPFLYTEYEFLSLCQALEVYCRINCDNFYLLDEKFNQIYNDLCQYLNGNLEGLKDNLKNKYNLERNFVEHLKKGTFKYANEYSFRNKLKSIENKYKNIFENLSLNNINLNIIANLRNYFTHYTDELKERVRKYIGREKEFALSLRQMLEVCLLNEINIPIELIKKRLKVRYESYNIVYWNDL